MNRLDVVIRALLFFCGLLVSIGGFWFLGDTGTYLAVIFGASTLFWIITWNRAKFLAVTGLAALLSPITSGLMLLKSFDASEAEVSVMQFAVLLVSSAACYIWIRQKVL